MEWNVGSAHSTNKFSAAPSSWSGKLRAEFALYIILFILTGNKLYIEWKDFISGEVKSNGRKISCWTKLRTKMKLYFSTKYHDPWKTLDLIEYYSVIFTLVITVAREFSIDAITERGDSIAPAHPSDNDSYRIYLSKCQELVGIIFDAVLLESYLQVFRGVTVVMMVRCCCVIRMLKL